MLQNLQHWNKKQWTIIWDTIGLKKFELVAKLTIIRPKCVILDCLFMPDKYVTDAEIHSRNCQQKQLIYL